MPTRHRGPRAARPTLTPLDDRLAPAADFDPTRVLVTLAGPAAAGNTAAGLAATSPVAAGVQEVGLGVYAVTLRAGVSVSDAVSVLSRTPGVASASPDYKLTSDAVSNDSRAGEQWYLRAPSSGRGGINAARGWDAGTGTGGTVVAVIDSGIDYNHPDLAANMWRNPGEVPGNGWDDDGNGFVDDVYGADFANNDGDPADDLGHGTHVAGIIGAVGNNNRGVTGVAWATKLMALKFMDSSGSGYTSNAVRAVDYAVAEGAKIINASWGGGPYNGALSAAIQRARAAGVIVVTSAGNNGQNTDTTPFYPAGYVTESDNVVVVAATTQTDALASWSNYGQRTVTMAAPGENILSTLPGGGYGLKSGTSMAAPMVAGALSVLWDQSPTWSARNVTDWLKSHLDPLSSLSGKTQTGGRLNLATLRGLSPVAPPVTPPPASPPPVPVTPPPPPASPPPPVTTGAGPVAASGGFSANRAGAFDRAFVNFTSAIDPSTLTADDVTVTGPSGAVRVSGVVPVAGSGNKAFYLMLSRAQSATGTYTVAVGPDVRDAAGRRMDQNGNGVGGEPGDVFAASAVLGAASPPVVVPPPASPPPPVVPPPPPPAAGGRAEYGVAPGAAINDLRTTRVTFDVTENVSIADLAVTLDLTHARTWDLSIKLVGPDGTTVTLFNRRGGDGANLTNTTFSDAGNGAIGWAAAPFNGTFRPEQALSAFNGKLSRGTWTLVISDVVAGATGRMNAATLSFRRP